MRQRFAFILFLAIAWGMGSCESPPSMPNGSLETLNLKINVEDSSIVSDAGGLMMTGDWSRVPADYYRSVRDLGWGSMGLRMIDDQDRVKSYTTGMPVDGKSLARVEGSGILPDGREYFFAAAPVQRAEGESEFNVALRVGPFGDREQEKKFLYMFARKLNGKPYPVRDRFFELPDEIP